MKGFLEGPRYSNDELMSRLRFFIGITLGLTLFGIVFVVLYSLLFITQPMNGISPVDNKFFELIIPIATFLTGTLSGIMLAGDNKDAAMKALDSANKGWDRPTTPTSSPTTPSVTLSENGITLNTTAPVTVGFNGKAAPPPASQPEI
jgi:hypothetical protein